MSMESSVDDDWDRYYEANRVTWSDEAYRLFGMAPQERQITYAVLPGLIHPEDQASVLQAIAEALGGARRYDVEYRVVRPNGRIVLLSDGVPELTHDVKLLRRAENAEEALRLLRHDKEGHSAALLWAGAARQAHVAALGGGVVSQGNLPVPVAGKRVQIESGAVEGLVQEERAACLECDNGPRRVATVMFCDRSPQRQILGVAYPVLLRVTPQLSSHQLLHGSHATDGSGFGLWPSLSVQGP